jgi:hypothetical protein
MRDLFESGGSSPPLTKTQTSLTAPERETVIITSDADDTITIHTFQRSVITKLRKNPSAILIEEGMCGTTAWAKFSLPVGLLSFRSGKRTGHSLTAEQKASAAERFRWARANRGKVAA